LPARLLIASRIGLLALAMAASHACAPALAKLPGGAGTPADSAEALREALAGCDGLRSVSAEVAVAGSVGGQRLRGRLLLGLAEPDAARIEAVAPFGPPLFIFVARNRDATLLLPREDRVLAHGRPADVLDAIAGLPLDAPDLRRALTACPAPPGRGSGRAFGDDWRVVGEPEAAVYLHRDGRTAPWRIAAVRYGAGESAWRADYQAFDGGLPHGVRLTSAQAGRFDLRLTLSQVERNPDLGDAAFRVEVPASAQPITIDELRRGGAIRGDSNRSRVRPE
jgi:outer membrane lipoprotein-sorting protein